jgi:hypothetical protein
MPIQLACTCGKRLKVAEEYAGKRVKCPACKVALVVPEPEEEPIECEVAEEEPIECDVAEEEPRAARRKARRPDDSDEEERPRRGKKKRPRRRSKDGEGALSAMYMKEAREQMRRDELRARAAGGFSRDDDGGGWTMGGVHITAGVLSGAGMLFVGLLAMALIFIIRSMDEEIIPGPRLFIAAIVCTTIGAITLIKSIFYGEED